MTSPDADAVAPAVSAGRVLRVAALTAYAAVLAMIIRYSGVPSDTIGISLLILIFLSILVAGRGWRAWWRMILDWAPFQAVLLAYDYSRGAASPYSFAQVKAEDFPLVHVHNSLGLPLRVAFPINVDDWIGRHLGMGGMPTAWVQQHLHPGTHVPWFAPLVSLTYTSHFVVMPTIAVVLWVTNRDRFRVWIALVVSLAVAGLTTYFLFPTAPPWMASVGGAYPGPAVGRYVVEGFDPIGLHLAGVALDSGQYLANPAAAMPSLHMGFATLAVGFFWWGKTWWQRVLLAMYPLAMGFSLLYGGEHYLTDELAGVVYAVTIIAVWRYLRRRRSTRHDVESSADRAESRVLTAVA